MICNYCGGTDVLKDAYAEWDGHCWVLHSVYDSTTCETCGGETSITETKETTQ
jgi:rRNA maturation endonuclease Nob1